MVNVVKVGQSLLGMLVAVLFFCVSSAAAARVTSPSYQVDGNLGGSFGGDTSSSSYKMTSLGGEAIVGNGASGSYILDQRNTSPVTGTMQIGVQPSGLVAFYPLDEGAGLSTADGSRNQSSGTLNAPAAWQAAGKIGNSVNINGDPSPSSGGGEGAVLVSDSSNLPNGSAMTVEAWVNQKSAIADRTIAGHWYEAYIGAHDPSWSLRTGNNNNLVVYIANDKSDYGDNVVITSAGSWNEFDKWRHVAVVYDGSLAEADRVKVYIDGVQVNTTRSGSIRSTLLGSAAEFSIGSTPGNEKALNGSIDHVKLFNRALGSAEIAAEYAAQNAGTPSGFKLEPTTSASTNVPLDTIVRTDSPNYSISLEQNHDLQSGANTIPAVSATIASPVTWSEGVTRGFGFTLVGAPVFDTKWSGGTKYAALPTSSTTFYNGSGNPDKTPEVITLQLRLHPPSGQPIGTYSNNVTYTGTMIP